MFCLTLPTFHTICDVPLYLLDKVGTVVFPYSALVSVFKLYMFILLAHTHALNFIFRKR